VHEALWKGLQLAELSESAFRVHYPLEDDRGESWLAS